MKTKKILCLALTVVMLFSALSFFTLGAETDEYQPLYDKETPVVLIHGIGQNTTYILDENGNRAKDENGSNITGWPLSLDVDSIIDNLVPAILRSVITRRDSGLCEDVRNAAYEAFYAIHKDNEGNYENKIEVPCFKGSFADMDKDFKSYCYRMIPVQKCGKIIGEDNLYYFGYDSLGDIEQTTKNLHQFITETVLPQTGAEKVNLCPISLGGSVAVSYLDMFKEDHKLIKNIVYVVPSINGSDLVGDILTGDLSTQYDQALYFDVLENLMGKSYTTYLVNMLLRILPKNVLQDALVALSEGVVETVIRPSTQLWATCPDEYYEEARAKWLSDDKFASIRTKVDNFMTARANLEKNHESLLANGSGLFNIVCYDLQMLPLAKDYLTTNSDGVLQAASTSMGATFAPLGKTLGEGYKAAGTYCNNPAHNHLSPDNMVDPTTGLLPCTTWYFKGQAHESLQYNDVCLSLATELMTDDNMVDVYSNPKAYPQYNGARTTSEANSLLNAFKRADKTAIASDKLAACEKAAAAVEAQLSSTVIDTMGWTNAVAELKTALENAGVIEKPETSFFEEGFTKLMRWLNQTLNKVL